MSNSPTMTQCRLMDAKGNTIDSWIESRGALLGKWVEVKGYDQSFEVVGVYDTLEAHVVKDNERNFISHRTATDI